MVDDIFVLKQHFELPAGHATFSLVYKQTQDHTPLSETRDPEILGAAWQAVVFPTLRDLVADDVRMPAVECRHVFRDNGDNVKVSKTVATTPAVGVEVGPSLPNNLCILASIRQDGLSRRTVGRVFIPGVPEAQTDGNALKAAYVNAKLDPFVGALLPPLVDPTDGGEWKLQVRSYKLFFAPVQAWKDGGEVGPRPDPDWAGSVADAISVSISPPITSQSRRATKVRGVAAVPV